MSFFSILFIDIFSPINQKFITQNDKTVLYYPDENKAVSILDESIQFFSVLKGDMSLVGPRPAGPIELEGYKEWQKRRLSVIPGLTGPWQVSGRNKVNHFDDWVNLDLEYIDNWSLWLDFKILIKTIPAAFSGSGM